MRNRRVELAVAALILAGVMLVELRSEITSGLWWQLVSGDTLLASGFPGTDPIAWPMAGEQWQVHGWLAHVVLAGLAQWIGLPGLLVFFAVLIGLTWTGLFVAVPGNPFGRAVIVLLAAVAASPLTSADAYTLSLVMFGAVVIVVELVARGRWPRWAGWAIAPVFVLWANLDSLYLLGVVYALLRGLGERYSRERDDAASDRLGAVLAGAAGGLVGAIINPYFVDGLTTAMVRLVGIPRPRFSELQSPDFQQSSVWPWVLLVGVLVVVMAYRPRRPLSELLVFFGFLVIAMMSYEFVPFHAVASVPIGAMVVAEGRSDRAPATAVAALAVGLWVLVVVVAMPAVDRWSQQEAGLFPVAAVDALEASGASGPVFNHIRWGGYLAYRGYQPYADMRVAHLPSSLIGQSIETERLLPAWEDLWKDGGFDAAVIRPDVGLTAYLLEDPAWTEIYSDEIAHVFVRTP